MHSHYNTANSCYHLLHTNPPATHHEYTNGLIVQNAIDQDNEELRAFIEQEIDELKQELKKDFPNEKLPD